MADWTDQIKPHLQDFFDRMTYQRGQKYASEGRATLESIQKEPELQKIVLKSKVQGSRWYRQSIVIRKTPVFFIGGTCSCPVGYNCKHVLAAIFTYFDTPEIPHLQPPEPHISRPNAFSQFLLNTKSHAPLKKTTLPNAHYPSPHIIYILSPTPERLFSIQLYVQSAATTERSQTTLTPIMLQQILQPNRSTLPPYVLLEDQTLAKHLLKAASRPPDHTVLLGDQNISPLLEALLSSERLYWSEVASAHDCHLLSNGPNKTVDFLWRKREDNLTYFEVLIEGRTAQFYISTTEPPYYVDLYSMTIGKVIQPLPKELLHRLLSLPGIPDEQRSELSESLHQEYPLCQALPLPGILNIEVIRPAPIPRLSLISDYHQGKPRYLGLLQFEYAGHCVAPDFLGHPIFVKNQGVSYEIKRDIEKEVEYRQVLIPQGFVHATRSAHGLMLALDEHLPAPAIIRKWQQFLEHGQHELIQAGWQVNIDANFKLSFHHIDQIYGKVSETSSHWFHVGLTIDFKGAPLPLLPLIQQCLLSGEDLNQDIPLLLNMGQEQWLEIPYEIVKPIVTTLIELYQDKPLKNKTDIQLSKHHLQRLLELETLFQQRNQKALFGETGAWRALANKLRAFEKIEPIPPPLGLKAELRDYQKQGLSWLNFIREYGFGGILADDMGLGKTIQALAYIQHIHETETLKRPILIIAPTSLLGNWRREAERFTPGLSILVWHGNERHQDQELLPKHHIIIASYGIVLRDIALLKKQPFHSVFLDEAQMVKNPKNKVSKAIRVLDVAHRFCLTGTPLENHLGELWALFDFLMPGFLNDDSHFRKMFRTPIEKQGDQARHLELNKRIAPFMLRRTKALVEKELPAKNEMLQLVTLEGEQSKLYEGIRLAMESKVRELLQQKGAQRSHIEILDALLKLRQVCCDPRLVKLPSAQHVRQSAKLTLLMDMIPELLSEGRSIIVFSQFTSMLELIEQELHKHRIAYTKLTGQTRDRDRCVDDFQSGKVKLFLISLKAGGFGLNLTAADTVIHYDPWWNPAVEAQATDRAHRIGQTKTVFVYKLIAENTVEERILALQARKHQLAQGTYEGAIQSDQLNLSGQDLLALFK